MSLELHGFTKTECKMLLTPIFVVSFDKSYYIYVWMPLMAYAVSRD